MKRVRQAPLVLVQSIIVRWHKSSRGAPGAVERNRVPEAFALPGDPPSKPERIRYGRPQLLPPGDTTASLPPNFFIHSVRFNDIDGFSVPASTYWTALVSQLPQPNTLRLGGNIPPILFESNGELGNGIQAQFSWHKVYGAPSRHHLHLHERARLALGQWAQIRFNARHSYADDGGWYYEKYVLNIGFVETLAPDIFVKGAPDHRISDMADLR